MTFRAQPFAAWMIGVACAYVAHRWAPQLSEAVVGMVCAGAAYLLIDMVSGRPNTVDHTGPTPAQGVGA